MRNILVIDDDRELCDLLQKYFSKEDFLLEHAGEGETGLALLARVRAVLRRLSVKQEQSDNADVSHEIRSLSNAWR